MRKDNNYNNDNKKQQCYVEGRSSLMIAPGSTNLHHHHHKHQGLDLLIRSVSRVTAARANASSFFQLFSFLVVCSDTISK